MAGTHCVIGAGLLSGPCVRVKRSDILLQAEPQTTHPVFYSSPGVSPRSSAFRNCIPSAYVRRRLSGSISTFPANFCCGFHGPCHVSRGSLQVRAMEVNDGVSQRVLTPLQKKQLELAARRRKNLEERYKIRVERQVSQERLKELGVERWSTWESGGTCSDVIDCLVDEQIYITQGELTIMPYECEETTTFEAGDLIRFPKWLVAKLDYIGEYEQRYRYLAYGDDN